MLELKRDIKLPPQKRTCSEMEKWLECAYKYLYVQK